MAGIGPSAADGEVKKEPARAPNLCIDVVVNTTPTHPVAKKRPIFSVFTKPLASVNYFTRSNTSEPRLSGEPGKFTAGCHVDVTMSRFPTI
jgi:hypothetical protein